MYKITFLLLLLILSACFSYKETNSLAIPPIARDELKITNTKK